MAIVVSPALIARHNRIADNEGIDSDHMPGMWACVYV